MLFNVDALDAIEQLVDMEEDTLEMTEANLSLFELVCLFPLSNKTSSSKLEEVFLFDDTDEFLSDSDIIL